MFNFINDLDVSINEAANDVFISKFADDTKLGREIALEQHCHKLQHALNELVEWSNEWGMELHAEKTTVVHFGRTNPEFVYTINGVPLNTTEVARDLGVKIRNDCDSSLHVREITGKAHALLGQVKRTLSYRDSVVLPKIYTTYVRPALEYAVQVWNPSKVCDVKEIEKVQRRAMRLVTDQGYMPYESKLQFLGLPTLEARRKRGDQIETFKIINGHSKLRKEDFFNHVKD